MRLTQGAISAEAPLAERLNLAELTTKPGQLRILTWILALGQDRLVEQKIFLGEYLDFQVKVRNRTLLARAHPSLRRHAGETIYVRINPRKCIAIVEGVAQRKAA